MASLPPWSDRIARCTRCPELRSYCADVAAKKKREFRDWDYWGAPVPAFGERSARLWIVGLAPAAHGANRTGRMFTGDSSGKWLYAKLHKYGFASQAESLHRDDGMRLSDVYISAVLRCAPPDNKPTRDQIAHCEDYLNREFDWLKEKKLLLTLGKLAFDRTRALLKRKGYQGMSSWRFAHGARFAAGNLTVLATFHPSRQNTNTGKLTDAMWDAIFRQCRRFLDG